MIPQIIFRGKRSISWKEVEKYLAKYVGQIIQIEESNDFVYIGSDFADEKGSIVHYNIYSAVLIVRYASDNQLYLYDIQNIRKE